MKITVALVVTVIVAYAIGAMYPGAYNAVASKVRG